MSRTILIVLLIALGAAFLRWVRDDSQFMWLCVFGGLFVAYVVVAVWPIRKLPPRS